MSATARTQIGGQGHNSPKVFTATGNPTAQNDSSDGAGIGDIWVNTSTNAVFICAGNTVGSAVWGAGAATFPGTAITSITDNTGGTASATLAAITAPGANATTSLTTDMTAVKNGLATLSAKYDALLAACKTAGIAS